ncbi:MAG: cobyrinate a,c-diamide synthase, partial [Desulfatiglandales bacterium]
MKAFIVAGTHSGCGKTTVTLGLLCLLKSLGYTVQAFKVGPDYIDQGLHGLITERPSRNLDLWMMGEEGVRESFIRNSSDADVAIVEGVMGLFDGPYGTWKVAEVLGIPIVLVMDSYGLAETVGPMAKGIYEECQNRGIILAGGIISKVGSEKHLKRIEGALPIPLLGYLPRDKLIEIPSRHLGLHVAEEGPIKLEALERLREHLSHSLDMDRLFGLSEIFLPPRPNPKAHSTGALRGTIAVPRDKAFCFYYQDNLDALEEMGFRITYFSPLEDPYPPQCDGIYIGGGYPEVYARELSQNKTMLKAIKELSFDKVPIYGECGGLIYL